MSTPAKSAPARKPCYYTLSALSAYLAANLSDLGGIRSQTAAEKLWGEEVVPAFKGGITSPEAAALVAGAILSDDTVQALHATVQEIDRPGGDKRAWLPDVSGVFLAHHLKELREGVWELLGDESTEPGAWWAGLPRATPRAGKVGAGKVSLDLSAVRGNARLAEAVVTLADYTARHDMSFTVQHGQALVKAGTKTLGAVMADGSSISKPDDAKGAAWVKDAKGRAKWEYQTRNFSKLSKAVQRTVIHTAGLMCLEPDSMDEVELIRAQGAKLQWLPISAFADLRAHLAANGVQSDVTGAVIGAALKFRELAAPKS